MSSENKIFTAPSFDASRAPSADAAIKTAYHLVNFNAKENAEHPFCLQAETDAELNKLKLVTITHSDFERAVIACRSWILANVIGTCSKERDDETHKLPIALIVESDLSILIYIWALFDLGIPVLLLSIRLSPEALRHLLSEVEAQAIITSPRLRGLSAEAVSGWTSDCSLPVIHLRESYSYFLEIDARCNYSIDKSWSQSSYTRDDDRNALILHSSGTTGLPKAIRQSHRYVLNYGQCHDSPGQETATRKTVSTLPLFHGFGLIAPLLSLTIGKTFVIPPSNVIPSASVIRSLIETSDARSLITVPSIIEEIKNLPHNEGIEILSKLDFVGCGGGTLKPNVGSSLAAAGVKVVNSYGCTEAGPLSVMYKPGSYHDWRYFKLRSDMPIQVHHSTDPSPQLRLTVKIPSWDDEFELQDYFEQSIDQSGDGIFLRPLERADNLIVLKNGEKVSPYMLESALAARDDVAGALVVGTGYFQLGVVVEPTDRAKRIPVEVYRKEIWETIEKVSLSADAHARITSPDAIIILQGSDVMQRSDKGAILPRDTLKKYDDRIQEMFHGLEDIAEPISQMNILDGDIEANLTALLSSSVWRPSQISSQTPSDDIFELGMDSLQSMQLRRLILSAVAVSDGLQLAKQRIPRDFVYSNPSISKMAAKLRDRAVDQPRSESRDRVLVDYLHKFSNLEINPDQSKNTQNTSSGHRTVVLLTGSTGQLGSHILSTLIGNEAVDQIICLNRPSSFTDPYARQTQCSKLKGAAFSVSSNKSKVTIMESKTDEPLLGLTDSIFRSLADSVTHIVHAAWPMDFNRHLSSFTSQFKTIQNLARLSLHKKTLPGFGDSTIRFLFVSSISVVGNHPNAALGIPIPEDELRTFDNTVQLGYAEAKLVCENLVRRFTESGLFRGSSVRMGQIAGSKKNGFWNAEEHFPVMLKASRKIGCLPKLSTTFSWLPVEDAAATVTDLLFQDGKETRPIYHVENPIRQPWGMILELISSTFGLPIKPYSEWLASFRDCYKDEIQEANGEHYDKTKLSAFALLEFFEQVFPIMSDSGVAMSTEYSQQASPSLARSGAVPNIQIQKYLDSWIEIGVFNDVSK